MPSDDKKPGSFVDASRVNEGKAPKLAERDTAGPDSLDKDAALPLTRDYLAQLRALQEKLYAESRWSLLLVLQGMDTAGKDGIVEHVIGGLNPQGCSVVSFKAPGPTELKHDFLWRCVRELPERGLIGIFNRSHYEEVVVARVHGDILVKQNLPPALITKRIWDERYESISAFERHLVRNGTAVVKIFLHISRKEQKARLLARVDEPDKNWKFNSGDIAERAHWSEYQRAYEDAIAATSTEDAPWYVVPADRKWYARLAVAGIIVDHLERIAPKVPQLGDADRAAMLRARDQLMEEP